MSTKISCKWKENMAFEMDVSNHKFLIDASVDAGGENRGPSPKALLLTGLAGCTAIDTISILNKMRVKLTDFDIEVEAELTEEHPRIYKSIHLVYLFKGKELPIDKLEKAVKLSQEKYCGVTAMLEKAATITYETKASE